MSNITPKACPLCRADACIVNRMGVTAGYGVKCVNDECGIASRTGTREQLPAIVAHWNQASMEAVGPRLNMDTVDYFALKAKYDALVTCKDSLQVELNQLKAVTAKYKEDSQDNWNMAAAIQRQLEAAVDKNAQYAVELGQLTAAYRYLMNLTEEALTDLNDALKVCPPLSKKPVVDALAKWKRFYENRIPPAKQQAVPLVNERSSDSANPPKPFPVQSIDHAGLLSAFKSLEDQNVTPSLRRSLKPGSGST